MQAALSNTPRFGDADDMVADIVNRTPNSSTPTASRDLEQGRIKTRFLNFRLSPAANDASAQSAPVKPRSHEALGTLTVVDGPGAGEVFEIEREFVQIGRGERQDIRLDFGDTAISRSHHASIAHYSGEGDFLIRDGMKPNPVLVNGMTLKGEARLRDGDIILIGQTTLRFNRA